MCINKIYYNIKMDLLIIYYTTVSAVSYSKKGPTVRNPWGRVSTFLFHSQLQGSEKWHWDCVCIVYTTQTKKRMRAEDTSYHQQL